MRLSAFFFLSCGVAGALAQDVKMNSNSSDGELLHIENTGTSVKTGVVIYNSTTAPSEGSVGLYADAGAQGITGRTYGWDWHENVYTTGISGIAEASGSYDVTSLGVYGAAYYCTECWGGYFDGDVIAYSYYDFSDEKLKKDINPLSPTLDNVMQLQPKTYKLDTTFTKQRNGENQKIGLLAQDVEKIFPQLVKSITRPTRDQKGQPIKKASAAKYLGINYTGLIPVLVKAIQEQQVQIQDQKAQMEAMRAEIASLKK